MWLADIKAKKPRKKQASQNLRWKKEIVGAQYAKRRKQREYYHALFKEIGNART